jgi:hypothetical protein
MHVKSIAGNVLFIYIKLGCVACVLNNIIMFFFLLIFKIFTRYSESEQHGNIFSSIGKQMRLQIY